MDVKRPMICAFAGSATPTDSRIIASARDLGAALGAEGFDLVYGGGKNGVMGAVACAALAAGARVSIIVPKMYEDWEHPPGVPVTVVETEADRFTAMAVQSNPVALFALPGGPGALREVMQGLERAIYEDGPPVVLAKTGDYLDGIRHYFDHAVSAGLIKASKAHCLKDWQPGQPIRSVLGMK